MPKSTNLNLELTTDDSTLFSAWRSALNGQGGLGSESNMQLIDEWAGTVNGLLSGIETLLEEI